MTERINDKNPEKYDNESRADPLFFDNLLIYSWRFILGIMKDN